MLILITLFLPVLALALVHYAVAVRHYGILSPDGLFVACQLLMLYGTIRLIDTTSTVDTFYAQLMAAATAIYIISSMITGLLLRRGGRLAHMTPGHYSVSLTRPNAWIIAVVVISLIVAYVYFAAIGYSAFWEGLKGQLSGTPEDVTTLRLQSYAGEKYLFPGFVNQFKNAILPGLTLVLTVWSFKNGGLFARAASICLMALAAFALLGTGQRGALVVFVTTTIVYAYLHNRRRLPLTATVPLILGLPLVLLSTAVLARTDDAPSRLSGAWIDLRNRFFEDNQVSGIAAFRYTSSLPVRYGGEWLDGLLSVLPGHRGSTLNSDVFYTLYRSTRGTSPPSLWGSVHYNFDTVGLIAFAALFGVALQFLTQRSLRRNNYNSLQLVGLAGITVVLGTWIAGGIETPLNVGLMSYVVLWYWGSRVGDPTTRRLVVQRKRAPGWRPTAGDRGGRTEGPVEVCPASPQQPARSAS
ncbi:oligosaccharide repeat unit polymerase [Micromonospora sp. C51]|uniref:oligosaccharide repeat unit polymerase n=1 Tax=Micromonospora sp. C51 TaxID=2824879 RepID=UPI001B361ACB|nr:oligosaccharide repeat unit polymerase [Micromonospora sp. C51]MBQ1047990.1 oligosaccharide repeat unit polymerase [Micromonospora sp. C51]